MPLYYARDDAKHRITIILTEPTTVADMVGSVERQLADGTWQYASLVDARASLVAPPPSDTRAFAASVGELTAAHGPRGPIAVVARDPVMISSAQRYAFSAGEIESLEVFWDIDDARRWLDERIDRR